MMTLASTITVLGIILIPVLVLTVRKENSAIGHA